MRDSDTMNSANRWTRSSSVDAIASLSAKALWRSMAARENNSDGETGLLLLERLDEAGREGVRDAGREGDKGLATTGSVLGM